MSGQMTSRHEDILFATSTDTHQLVATFVDHVAMASTRSSRTAVVIFMAHACSDGESLH